MSRMTFGRLLSALLSIETSAWAAPPHAYVANEGDGTVSVIDTDKDEVARTLTVHGESGDKLQAALADRGERTLFVVDAKNSQLVAVDLASGQAKQRIAAGKSPEGATLSPSGKTIAVCGEDDNAVTFVNVSTQKVIGSAPIQGKNPEHCEWSSDERWLLTSNENSDDVDVIDVKARKSSALIRVGGHPRGIAILPGKHVAYIAQETTGGVDVVDFDQRKVLRSIPTGVRPAGAIATADGSRVFIANGGSATVSVIDTGSNKVIADIPVGKRAWNMALSANGKKLYVANGRSNSVTVIDTTTLKPVKEITVGERPWGVQIP